MLPYKPQQSGHEAAIVPQLCLDVFINHKSMLQVLKLRSEYFDAVLHGLKRAEVRFDDRNYAVGDLLEMHELRDGELTGRVVNRRVMHVQPLDGIGMKGWVLLSLRL